MGFVYPVKTFLSLDPSPFFFHYFFPASLLDIKDDGFQMFQNGSPPLYFLNARRINKL
jgi:hypothetical protein